MGQSILTQIAQTVGTPAFVYDAEAIRSQVGALRGAFGASPPEIHYSVKANSNLAVLRLMHELGTGADIVSVGELHRVLAAGFDAADLVFSGVGKRQDELTEAVRSGVGLINIENEGELEHIIDAAEDVGKCVKVGIRVNPDVTADTHPYTQTGSKGMKFGVPLDEVMALAKKLESNESMHFASIAMHIGSQISDPLPYREGAEQLAQLIATLKDEGMNGLETVDVGGGMGVQYDEGDCAMDLNAFAEAVLPLQETTGLRLAIEPGRVIVGNAGTLLTRVLYRKKSGGHSYAIVDAGMNDFGRPSYYGARHRIDVIDPRKTASEDDSSVDVVGPICESGDYQGLERPLVGAGVGALLGIRGTGAYGFTMGSNYNSRPRPPEVMVDGDQFSIVRDREDIGDLWKDEVLEPVWVKGIQQ